MHLIIYFVILSSVITGCSTLGIGAEEYSCSGMPNGVHCMSARDVYQSRNKLSHNISNESKNNKYNEQQHTNSIHTPKKFIPQNNNADLNRINVKRTPSDVAIIMFNSYQDKMNIFHKDPIVIVSLENATWTEVTNIYKPSGQNKTIDETTLKSKAITEDVTKTLK
jgi:hypothetical protein